MTMEKVHSFIIPASDFRSLQRRYPNAGKNSHIGRLAVEIAQLYFRSVDPGSLCTEVKDGSDLEVRCKGKTRRYEVKGTADDDVAYSKLKVSSWHSYNALKEGVTLLRITKVGQRTVELPFLRHGIDFKLVKEPRWAVQRLKAKGTGKRPR
jgi:hypothetical protein